MGHHPGSKVEVRHVSFRRLLPVALVAIILQASAAEPVTVFLLDIHHDPVTRLDKLNPPLSEPLRSILAMYALQNGGGCQGENDPKEKGLHCVLTTALGVGPQCSAAQLRLIRDWFKGPIPKMSGYEDKYYQDIQPPGVLENICYESPDTASIQEAWARIRVSQDGPKVEIDAVGDYLDRDEGGHFHYKTTYLIEDHSIKTLSHTEIPWKGQSKKEE